MCSLYQSQEVSCFNVDKWNLVTRTAQYDLHKKNKNNSLSLGSSCLLFPCLTTADLMHRIKTEPCEFCMNKSFTSVYFTSFHGVSSLLFLSAVHLHRSSRRGRCCKLWWEGTRPFTPCPWNWDEQPDCWRWMCPTVPANPDYFNDEAHSQCLYCNFCHKLVSCT